MFIKKLKKLKKDPSLFIKDMLNNKKKSFTENYSLKVKGENKFTVVSAVYNTGRYLECFFESFEKQKLSFKNNIKLIMVDDGSTDESSSLIKKWVRKYPKNIKYIYKENGGQSSARNLGLKYVDTKWVTFIDPDDFVDSQFFFNIDNYISKNSDSKISLLGCKIIFFFENTQSFKDTHPLNFKFANEKLIPIDKISKEIQLSASSAIFDYDIIKDNNILFDSKVKPNFEDAHFIAHFLLKAKKTNVSFLKNAVYYYRKREDGTSTLDTSWTKVERFENVPKFGYLDILETYKKELGFVPLNIQRTVLYEAVWYMKWCFDKPGNTSFLSEETKDYFIESLNEIFKYIDKQSIMAFELAGCWFFYKLMLLGFFKNEKPNFQIAYVEKFDSVKKLVQIRYFTTELSLESFSLDGVDLIPFAEKSIQSNLMNRKFLVERRIWLKLEDNKNLTIKIDNLPTHISLGGKNYSSGVNCNKVVQHFKSIKPSYKTDSFYENSWVLMDRDIQADDNAEHLYNYIRNEHPEQKIFFALNKDSHDWKRLKSAGFQLLAFGSEEHKLAIGTCEKLISSHANHYVTNFLGSKMLTGRHFVFLQHGVILHDISSWLNTKENIDCFITTTNDEYNSIIKNSSNYAYSNKEVVLTGLPRHDALVTSVETSKRQIVIMPTWRKNIVGNIIGDGDTRSINSEFMSTEYAKSWHEVLHSEKLKNIAQEYNFDIIFFPHANIEPYLEKFNIPQHISAITHHEGSIQEIFKSASIMITDYSSVAFEMAVQNKPTIYYQFDEQEFFSGQHTTCRGDYDYRKHGFGPVTTTLDELLNEIGLSVKNEAKPTDEISKRIFNTFPFRDGKNCERTYLAIKELDQPLPDNYLNLEILYSYAQKAYQLKNWPLSESRWKLVINNEYPGKIENHYKYIDSLLKQNKISEALSGLSEITRLDDFNESELYFEYISLALTATHNWKDALYNWEKTANFKTNPSYWKCLAMEGKPEEIKKISFSNEVSVSDIHFLNLYILIAENSWAESITYVQKNRSLLDEWYYPALLLMSYSYQKMFDPESAHNCLIEYEKHIQTTPECRYEIIRIAFANKAWKKAISQLSKVSENVDDYPSEFKLINIQALFFIGLHKDALDNLYTISASTLSSTDFNLYIQTCLKIEAWDLIFKSLEFSNSLDSNLAFLLSLSIMKMGDYSRSFRILKENDILDTKEYWNLRYELSQINSDWNDASNCWIMLNHNTKNRSSDKFTETLLRLKLLSSLESLNGNKKSESFV